jgi:hypothetical protein
MFSTTKDRKQVNAYFMRQTLAIKMRFIDLDFIVDEESFIIEP